MCWYHVTFHLDLELEHTLDGRSPGDNRMQVWSRSGHLSATRSDLRKKFTDGRTDDGRRAIALAHWNEVISTRPILLLYKSCKNSLGGYMHSLKGFYLDYVSYM